MAVSMVETIKEACAESYAASPGKTRQLGARIPELQGGGSARGSVAHSVYALHIQGGGVQVLFRNVDVITERRSGSERGAAGRRGRRDGQPLRPR